MCHDADNTYLFWNHSMLYMESTCIVHKRYTYFTAYSYHNVVLQRCSFTFVIHRAVFLLLF